MVNNENDNKFTWFTPQGVVRSVKWYLPATIIYRAISFVRGFILAWLLAKNVGQYGLLTLSLQIINILAPLVSLGMTEAITRYISSYKEKTQLGRFILRSGLATIGITILISLVLAVFSKPLGYLLFAKVVEAENIIQLVLSILVTIVVIIFYFTLIAVLRGLRLFSILSVFEIVHGVLFLIFALVGVVYISASAEVVIWSYTFALFIPSVVCTFMLYNQFRGGEEKGKVDSGSEIGMVEVGKQLIRFGFWIAGSGVTGQVWFTFSLWFLARFVSSGQADVFSASRLIGQIIVIVGLTLVSIITPAVYTLWERNREYAARVYDTYTKAGLLLLFFFSLIIADLSTVIGTLFPRRLSGIALILPGQVLFFYFISVIGFLTIYFNLIEKTRLTFWSWLAGLGFNIICGVLWIRGEDALIGSVTAMWVSAIPAILITMILIRAEGQKISLGLVVLVFLPLILLLPSKINLFLFGLMIGIFAFTTLLFDSEQKALLKQKLVHTKNFSLETGGKSK